jgi:hypothetical protein
MSYIQALRGEIPSFKSINESRELTKGMAGMVSEMTLPPLGCHPDFSHLIGTLESEEHWIISGFIDVKKSTHLFNRFTKETVAVITESIVKASMYAVLICDGYTHRIQGDGLMVYFGGKNQDKGDATYNALKAFSMISYFIKNDLKDHFESLGIKDIHTRGGLDLGHDNQVRWIYSGYDGGAGEVTTVSLHTNLAPKMQAKALQNGIVVGKNIYNQFKKEHLFTIKSTPIWYKGDDMPYDHYDFDWERFLREENLLVEDRYGKKSLVQTTSEMKKDPALLATVASLNKPYGATE